jgi:hypothetical protein
MHEKGPDLQNRGYSLDNVRELPTRMYYAPSRLRSSEMEKEASKCPRKIRYIAG